MKKLTILTAGIMMTLAAANNTYAQSSIMEQGKKAAKKHSYISLGPAGSIGDSWVNNLPGSTNFKISPALGVGIVYSRSEHWGFGEELLISHEGYSKDYMLTDGRMETVTVNPVYLSMPMHVTYFFGRYGNLVRPKIFLGPTVALRVDERHDYSMDAPVTEGLFTTDNQYRRFDFGVNGGVGLNIRLVSGVWLNVDAAYYQGLVDAIKNDPSNAYNTNSNLRLNMGVMIGL